MNKLPSDWQIKTINEVCNIYTGNSINKKKKEEPKAPAAPPADIQLLTEIRDLLKKEK